MVFDLTKGFVPEAYSKSRDYKVFLRLAGLVSTVLKYNIDNLGNLYEAENCPVGLLDELAGMVGYTYKDSRTVASQRKIISYYPFLLRNRGSATAIEIATALSLSTLQYKENEIPLDRIYVDYDATTGKIIITYPSEAKIDKDIINDVRPVGTFIEFRPSVGRDVLDGELKVKVTASGSTHNYTNEKGSIYNEDTSTELSSVNFGSVAREEIKEPLKMYTIKLRKDANGKIPNIFGQEFSPTFCETTIEYNSTWSHDDHVILNKEDSKDLFSAKLGSSEAAQGGPFGINKAFDFGGFAECQVVEDTARKVAYYIMFSGNQPFAYCKRTSQSGSVPMEKNKIFVCPELTSESPEYTLEQVKTWIPMMQGVVRTDRASADWCVNVVNQQITYAYETLTDSSNITVFDYNAEVTNPAVANFLKNCELV